MTRDEQALWDGIADEAVRYIDERADERGASELRVRYADILGKNNFANRDFEALVDSMFDSFRNIEEEYARSNDRLEDFLPKAVADVVDGHFANSVLSNRRTADELDNRTYAEMEDMVKLYKDLLGGRGRGGRGGDRDRGRDSGRGGRDERGGSGYSRGGRGDRDRGRTENLGRTSGGGGGGWRNQKAARTKVAAGDHWAEAARDARDTDDRLDEARQVEEVRRPAAAKPLIADSPLAPVESRPVLEGPDYTKARPHDEFLQDGEHWKVASKSGWTIPFDYNNPLASVPKLYDVRTQIKYHVKNADGKVREELVKVTDDNRYLAHEGMQQPERYHSTSRRNTPAVSLSGAKPAADDDLNQVDAKPVVTNLQESLGNLDRSQFEVGENGAPLGETLNGLVFNTRVKMVAGHDSQRLNICYRHTALIATSWEQESLIQRIYGSHNLSAAAQALRDLKNNFDITIWNELNKRFSDLVLRAVRFQFQHNSVKAMSFANDWEKLIKHLEGTKGEGFASDFAQRTSYIIPMACAIASREDLSAFTELPEGQEAPCVVFLDSTAIVALDSTLDALGLGKQLAEMETGASITAQADRGLNAVVLGMYSKLDDKAPSPGATRVYLNTNDGAILELIPFAARKENFIITVVK
jgi:very-short-patch-repair endonuclease